MMTSKQQTGIGSAPSDSADAVPCVGIFWFVMQSGRPELLTCRTPWPEAEDYGDFKPRRWPITISGQGCGKS